METKATTVDAYLAALPEEQRLALEGLRATIRAAAPEAVEGIAYAMPSFKYRGRPLAYFGAAKNHVALYGLVSEAHHEELSGYVTSKGTIRFTLQKPLPESLVKALIVERMQAIDAAEAARQARRSRRAKL